MLDIYRELNDSSKNYITEELYSKTSDKKVLERCLEEIDILYNHNVLFLIEGLYIYKLDNNYVEYDFKGTIKNSLLLSILGMTKNKSNKKRLSISNIVTVEIINDSYINFLNVMEVVYITTNKIIKGNNHYIIIPSNYSPNDLTFRINKDGMFEVIEDYNSYKDNYLTFNLL